MNKYVKLISASTPYAEKMTNLRNRIFGDVVGQMSSKSKKTVKMFSERPIYMRDEYVNYYPRYKETTEMMMKLRKYGLYRDEHMDFVEEMERRRALRGKGVADKRKKAKIET